MSMIDRSEESIDRSRVRSDGYVRPRISREDLNSHISAREIEIERRTNLVEQLLSAESLLSERFLIIGSPEDVILREGCFEDKGREGLFEERFRISFVACGSSHQLRHSAHEK